jgi:hypothetical protein
MHRPFSFSLSIILFSSILSLFSSPSWGWIATGHKMVALVAWDDLTPKTKEAVTAILKQHPQYEKELMLDAPADETPAEKDRTAFATAATWPDLVRDQDNPMHTLYNHPGWHYIDMPFATGGQTAAEQTPQGPGPHDAVEAYAKVLADLKDTTKSAADRAIALCWVEHLVGDIHQPLHSTSLFSPEYPRGDQGGNAEVILRDPPYPDSSMKLHLLWDELPGDFSSEELIRYEAQGLRSDPKYSREKMKDLLTDTDFLGWAKESHELAIHYAYLDGNLKTAPAPSNRGRRSATTNPTPGVPPGYVNNAEHVAMHQVALGGYRLADVLNGIFDPK